MRRSAMNYCFVIISSVLCLIFLGSCTAEIPTAGDPMIYPMQHESGGDLDIQLNRDGYWNVDVTNRSSKRIDQAILWLNDGWGKEIQNLEVGQTINYDLESFINEYGQSYPTGNPIQPRLSKPIMKADLQMDGQVFRLNILMEKDWRTQY